MRAERTTATMMKMVHFFSSLLLLGVITSVVRWGVVVVSVIADVGSSDVVVVVKSSNLNQKLVVDVR
jgi:hypothetical protein